MAQTNHDRVGRALDLLRDGLRPFLERELEAHLGKYWVTAATQGWKHDLDWNEEEPHLDVAALLKILIEQWNDVFKQTLGPAERSYVFELRDHRNAWAHQKPISSDDCDRALDTAARLLTAVSAPEAAEVERMKHELRREVYEQQVRDQKKKLPTEGALVAVEGALPPWRQVVTPHDDVATGRYQTAEFAADLWQVHLHQGSDEYRDPTEFFRRTYLTASLQQLLVNAVRRLTGAGGDPVVQLQTNFGGGKTHSMLALFHLVGGAPAGALPGVESLLAEAGATAPPAARRVVLVGNRISPGNPVTKPDGTVVRTLWGELAWQLGGPAAYARLAADDERATCPGDVLRELLLEFGPALILIDEWVAYARQLHDDAGLPGGTFETQFTFAQALTEAVKLAGHSLLVISLPASDTGGSPHTAADDVEVGGLRGREALDRLRNVVGRLETSWRPATAEEGFEIVRRRLFKPLGDAALFTQRDLTARAFADLYRAQAAEFPPECRESAYEQRLRAAYPIHPEIFDRLYGDWSTLAKFQRTRGVLRLMAAVIHTLWERGDHSPLILPSTVPLDDPRVQDELTRYLSDNWRPVLDSDVDGPQALPQKIDREVPNLGKLQAARRVARTIYLGSAPTSTAAHRGLEDRRIKLGCVMPGETPAVFGDALRRLAQAATYLYPDGNRYWYATQPTVTKLADDRAEQLKRETDRVGMELDRRVREALRQTGDFTRVHALPRTSADVPDEYDTRLVVLPHEQPYVKGDDSPALKLAKEILEHRGNAARHYLNTLVFLAADKVRVQDLDEAARRYLAWRSILDEQKELNLDPHQVKQAEAQCLAAEGALTARVPETYVWLLAPEYADEGGKPAWSAWRLTGSEPLAERASRRLKSADALAPVLGATVLRTWLDKIPMWREDDVAVTQLVEDFAACLNVPRLSGPQVLLEAIQKGVQLLTWRTDSFAYAESRDQGTKRYQGLQAGQVVTLTLDSGGLLVRPEVAGAQLDAEVPPVPPVRPDETRPTGDGGSAVVDDDHDEVAPRPEPPRPRRWHGTVALDADRVARDAGTIAQEVIVHLAGQVGAKVTVTLEIEADLPDGATEHVVRVVTENSAALKFSSHGFERE